MRERGGGTVKAKPIAKHRSAKTIHGAIHENVESGSTLHTDEFAAYRGLAGLFFGHETINHGAGEFVRDGVTTNGIESVFAVMKRGIIGIYHHASPKHLGRYVDEFSFRLNEGNVKRHTLHRLGSFVAWDGGQAPDLQGADRMTDQPKIPKLPKAVEDLADAVLRYRPKPKSAPAAKRKRRAAKIVKDKKHEA